MAERSGASDLAMAGTEARGCDYEGACGVTLVLGPLWINRPCPTLPCAAAHHHCLPAAASCVQQPTPLQVLPRPCRL